LRSRKGGIRPDMASC